MPIRLTAENAEKRKFNWRNWFIFIVLIGLLIAFSLLHDSFFSLTNFQTIGRQTAMVSIIAFGATFVITAGQIDLSVGAILGLVGIVAATIMQAGGGPVLASTVGLLLGAGIGLANGLLVAIAKIPAFLVTLGTMSIARGLALTITNTKPLVIMDDSFIEFWGAGSIGGFPTSILWTAIIFFIALWLYRYHRFGNYVKAIGGNKTAALFSGIKVNKQTILVFVLAGLLAAVSALIMAARLKSGRPEVGSGYELEAITAVILGGTLLSGGKGKMPNTLVGSLIVGIIVNGLTILGVQSTIQQVIKGIIIISAVSLGEKE